MTMTKYYFDGDKVLRGGRTFKIIIERDEWYGAPWEECDGHGPVSEWTTRDKAPGERVLYADRRSKQFYDFATAVEWA